MQVGTPQTGSHSAQVTATLQIGDREISLGSIGPDHVIARDAFECEPDTVGELLMTVDGKPMTWQVTLPEGATLASKRVAIKDCD